MANNGARKEQIQGAYELWQQAKAAKEIAEKSYNRVQRLFDEGVMTAQKRDEALAMYKASEAQEKAAKSQYDMAVNGARAEEKAAAQGQVKAFSGQMDEVKVYEKETIQIAPIAGEVSTIYPKVGELLGSGSPIMTISIMDDLWGAFNMREDQLKGLKKGDTFTAYLPAFDKEIEMKVSSIKDQGSYATWKATKSNGQFDMKTFEVKARPTKKFDGLRPGMSVLVR
jgi:HlyD family secretion protein